jgi:hypothetical protein
VLTPRQRLVSSALAYWITGYAFAFGGQANSIVGTRFWASEHFGANELRPGVDNYTQLNPVYQLNNQDPYIHFFYHYMLAFLVTNIAASSFAERCRVPAYVLFSVLMSGRVHGRARTHATCLVVSHRIALSLSRSLDVGGQRLARSDRRCSGQSVSRPSLSCAVVLSVVINRTTAAAPLFT